MSFADTSSLMLCCAGLALFSEIPRSGGFRVAWQQRIFGAGMFVAMSGQIFDLFPSVNAASSLQFFCFIGCTLGCVGSMRLMINVPTK